MPKSTPTLTAYLLHKSADRLRVISNWGKESTTPKQPSRQAARQAGRQAARQPGRWQAGSQAAKQAGRQAGRQAAKQPAQGDLGQFLGLGKNPYAWQHIWGKKLAAVSRQDLSNEADSGAKTKTD